MHTERNLSIYTPDPAAMAAYLNAFGMHLMPEGSEPTHWFQEQGYSTVHVCIERRHDPARLPDEPGIHGLWHYLRHRQGGDE